MPDLGAPSGKALPTMPTLAGSPTGAPLHTSPPVMPTLAGGLAPQHLPPALPPARYELRNEIARGGMGRVVNATDTVLDRMVAFKEALTTDADTLRRFERETRITARLEHPSIVPVHDAGASSNGSPFYVMRRVSGQPLERLVASAETLNQRLALIPHIVASAQAIAHAHERNIVHRDIKPSNILVGDLGETVVIDWGLAKLIGEPDEQIGKPLVDLSDSLKTRVGIVYGTPGFMAPEQLRGAPVNEGCDVYALGATLYHLLSRKPPHHAKTADEMMKAAVAAPPTPIRELVAGVPPELSTIVDKALAHDPKVRYQNARALAEDLQHFLTGQLVASHHYSPREKLVRFVRKNRGVTAAVIALVVVGTLSVIRIINERDRARAAEHEAVVRAEQLTLAQARSNVETNPTRAVAMLKPLAAKYWREVRAIAAAARAAGVAWGIPASKHTASLEISHDGLGALSAGNDGVIRLHDLARRTTRSIADLGTEVMARFADGERQIVTWHGAQLAIFDARTGARRDLTTAHPVADLEVVGTTAYWVDDQHALWKLELAGTAPERVSLEVPVHALAPSPGGRWIALSGDDHLYLYDRTQPTPSLFQVVGGDTQQLAWSDDGEDLAALIDQGSSGQLLIGVTMTPRPTTIHHQSVRHRQFVAEAAGHIYTIGDTGIAILSRDQESLEPLGRQQLSGTAVGLAESRGGTVVSGATGGITVISDDGDQLLPLQGARVEGVVASPRSPYVIAQLEGRLLVWNLDEIQPRRLGDKPAGSALFATADQVIVGGTDERQALAFDVAGRAVQPLGEWQGLTAITAPADGHVAAILDGEHHVHLVAPGREPEELPGEIDIVGFATADKLVLATQDGAIYVHDLEHHQRTPIVQHHSYLLGLAWGRGRHPWIAAAFLDGTLWRKNMTTGVEATTARVPRLEVDPTRGDGKPPLREGKLIVGDDGAVVFLHDSEVHVWRADGKLARLANTTKPIEDFGEAGPAQIVAIASDNTVYTIARDAADQTPEPVPSVDGTSAAMSPDTGMLVVLDHGAIDVIDPLARQTWTLAAAAGVMFSQPQISTDGRRVLAQTTKSLLVWSLDLPTSARDTATWLDAMTNAVEDHGPVGLGWR
jgi:hypothetical protein